MGQGDTPEYTERQLAQNWLIHNAHAVLRTTGRSNGFPNEPPEERDHEGPPPVIITRIASDTRNSWGETISEESLDGDDISTLVNAFTPKQNLELLEVPEEVLDQLTPRVELYKSYPHPDDPDETYDVLFRPKWNENTANPTITQGSKKSEKQTQVGITGLTIKKLGGNPAEIESNIVVDLKISTMDLNNLFYRYRPEGLGGPQAEGAEGPLLPGVQRVPPDLAASGVAWIDLIKMDPSALSTTESCDRIYNEADARIKLVIGYNRIERKAIEGILRSELENNTIGRKEITPDLLRQWEAAGTPFPGLAPSRVVRTIIDLEGNFEPIVDEDGIQSSTGVITDGRIEQRIDQIVEIVNKHEEIYYLSLKKHDLIINTDLTVEMTVHFVAHGQVVQQMWEADLLDDPLLKKAIAVKDTQIANLEARRGAAQSVDILEGDSEEERAAKRLENTARETIAQGFTTQLEQAREARQSDIGLRNKKLYNQLRLAGSEKSRIYLIAFPIDTETKKMAMDAPPLIGNFNRQGRTVEAAFEDPEDQLLDEYREEMEEEDTTMMESERTTLDTASFTDGQYKLGRFVFFGDIIEAALEIVAHNNLFTRDTITDALSGGPFAPQTEQDWENLLTLSRLDGAQYPTFWEEMAEDGTLGEGAQKTIKHFGKFVCGDIEIPKRTSDGARRFINIADIPVDLGLFRQFWYNDVVSKPAIKKYFLKNLINGLLNRVLPEAIINRDFEESSVRMSGPETQPKAILSFFTVKGDGTELNSRRTRGTSTTATLESYLNPSGPMVSCEDCAFSFDSPPPLAVEEPEPESIRLLPMPGWEYVDYISTSTVRQKIESSFETYSGINTYDVFLIHQKQERNIQRTGIEHEDRQKGIYHFRLSNAEKKSLMNVQFKRSDLRGLAEANLMSDQGANRLGLLREKYDATLQLRGNAVYKVGSMLYLKPDSLQGTYIQPTETAQARVGESGILHSAARAIGLGGYYTVTSLSHDFGSLGKGGKWRTLLETRWNSFAYNTSLPSCEEDAPAAALAAEIAADVAAGVALLVEEYEREAGRQRAAAIAQAQGVSRYAEDVEAQGGTSRRSELDPEVQAYRDAGGTGY